MFSKTLFVFIFATFYSSIYSDTRGLYNLAPVAGNNNNNQHSSPLTEERPRYYDSSVLSNDVALPRMANSLWNPFDNFSLDYLLQPSIVIIGFIFGAFGFFSITDWLSSIVDARKKLKIAYEKAEETNEIDRKKRTITPEETKHVLDAIESLEKKLER